MKKGFISSVEDLEVFQLSYKVSLEVHNLTLGFPKIEQYGGLADQMRRASKSICSNLSEGFLKQSQSKAEFKRFVFIALGSAGEMRIWSKYSYDLNYIKREKFESWYKGYTLIIKMLQNLRSPKS